MGQKPIKIQGIHKRDHFNDCQLIVINQSVGPSFLEWLRRFVHVTGSLELWTGNVTDKMDKGIVLSLFTRYNNASLVSRFVTWTRFVFQVTWQLLHRRERTPIFVVSNPPLTMLVVWLFATLQKRRYGVLEWDIYPQVLAEMGLINPENPLYRLWHRVHAGVLKSADLIVTIGDGMADVLRRMANDKRLSVTVIPNWVDTCWLRPLPREDNQFVQEQGIQDKLVILYSGNLGATHAVETIIRVAEFLGDEPRICFLVIGDGSKRKLVEAAVASGKTPYLRLMPLQPTARLPETLSSGHIGIVTLGKGYNGLSIPSKTYALMAAGNAILSISQPPNDLSNTINRHGCGVNFTPDEPEEIAAWLRSLLADPVALRTMQARSRQAAVREFDASRCIALLSGAVSMTLLKKSPINVTQGLTSIEYAFTRFESDDSGISNPIAHADHRRSAGAAQT